MKHHYKDITDKLGTPIWWDENGTPRYCLFHPKHTANIYATEAALARIECQGCRAEFDVCLSSRSMESPLHERIDDHRLHYGDPPNFGCCPSGPTMNSIMCEVLQFWVNNRGEWERNAAYEIEINKDR